jgi:hypothetical protein
MTAKPQPKMFQTELCGRCGGDGTFSFNLRDGSVCYGCGGTGWKLTKAGAAARAAWEAGWRKQTTVSSVNAGDKVVVKHDGRRLVKTVTESGPDPLNAGRWNLTFANPTGNPYALTGYGFVSGDDLVELPVTGEEKRAAYDAIASMPGIGEWPS